MKHVYRSWPYPRSKTLLMGALVLLQLLFSSGAVASTAQDTRMFWLQGECYRLTLPSGFSALRGLKENMVCATFAQEQRQGILLISAMPLQELKASLEESGIVMADWLLSGIAGDDQAAMLSVAGLAKAAGFQGASVEDAGDRKALIYEVAADAPAAMAISIEGKTVLSVQVSLEGAKDYAHQRLLVKQVLTDLKAQTTLPHVFGKHLIHVPGDWSLQGTGENATLNFQFTGNGSNGNALVTSIPLGKEIQQPPVDKGELADITDEMLAAMIQKLLDAGLTADDGLVRLYDLSASDRTFWIALLIHQDTAILCGVQVDTPASPLGRESIELLVRGLASMAGSGRTLVLVAEN